MEGAILGIGNPLLDISAEVPATVLTKYDVQVNNAILAEEKHMPIYDELIKDYPVQYIAGGATQNSIRVAQWMLKPGCTGYMGAIGMDSHGDTLEKCAGQDGVQVHYMKNAEIGTGTCAVLVYKTERSLIANLSAANTFKESHMDTDLAKEMVERAKIFMGGRGGYGPYGYTHGQPQGHMPGQGQGHMHGGYAAYGQGHGHGHGQGAYGQYGHPHQQHQQQHQYQQHQYQQYQQQQHYPPPHHAQRGGSVRLNAHSTEYRGASPDNQSQAQALTDKSSAASDSALDAVPPVLASATQQPAPVAGVEVISTVTTMTVSVAAVHMTKLVSPNDPVAAGSVSVLDAIAAATNVTMEHTPFSDLNAAQEIPCNITITGSRIAVQSAHNRLLDRCREARAVPSHAVTVTVPLSGPAAVSSEARTDTTITPVDAGSTPIPASASASAPTVVSVPVPEPVSATTGAPDMNSLSC